MTLIEFYEMVNNDSTDNNTLYVAVGINCADGVVYREPSNPYHWTYRFLNLCGKATIQSFTSTPINEGYGSCLTVWINSPYYCDYVRDNHKPTPYNASTLKLNNDDNTDI